MECCCKSCVELRKAIALEKEALKTLQSEYDKAVQDSLNLTSTVLSRNEQIDEMEVEIEGQNQEIQNLTENIKKVQNDAVNLYKDMVGAQFKSKGLEETNKLLRDSIKTDNICYQELFRSYRAVVDNPAPSPVFGTADIVIIPLSLIIMIFLSALIYQDNSKNK